MGTAGGGWQIFASNVFNGGINLFTGKFTGEGGDMLEVRDTIDVLATEAGSPVMIDTGSGITVVNVGDAGSLAGIQGSLAVHSTPQQIVPFGEPDVSTLNLNGSADTVASIVKIQNDSVAGLTPNPVSYTGMTNLVVSTGTC